MESQFSLQYSQTYATTLGCCDRASWTYGEERETNKMQLIRCLLSNYLNMFRASLCPS